MEVNSETALKRVSTDRKRFREKAGGVRFLRRIFGTCLGALYENTTYAGVNGLRVECQTLIRVVPPSFSVPCRDGKARRFCLLYFHPVNIYIEKEKKRWQTKN